MIGHRLYHSSMGRKVLMATTGLLLLGFVIAHLLGNLLIFLGPEALNAYALKLRHLGPGLWIARLILLGAVGIHIWTSSQLTLEKRKARPVAYQVYHPSQTTHAARSMMLSGLLIVAYLAYHLLHFTFRVTNPEVAHLTDTLGRHDVYRMMVSSFQHWPISLAYLVGVAMVCLHLSHGIGSSMQTLGMTNERTLNTLTRVGQGIAAALFVGYASIPLAVLLGVIRSPGLGP